MLATISSYIILGLSIAAPIGPINIEIIKRGLRYGFWAAFLVGVGGISSDLALMALMFFGLSNFMTIVWVKIALTLLGCVILVHSGVNNLRLIHQVESKHDPEHRNGLVNVRSYLSGMTIAASNPMNLLFWLGIYGSVLSGVLEQSNHLHAFVLSSLVFIGIALWNLNLAFTVHFGRLLMNRNIMKTVNVIASIVLIGFGIKFGWIGLKELFLIFSQ